MVTSPDLAKLAECGRLAWPALGVTEDDLAAHLAGAGVTSLPGLAAEDLWLAAGCRAGRSDALAEFERRVLPQARAALVGRRLGPDVVEEALQVLRQRLFVAAEGPGKIAEYTGRGPLVAWTRMAALRVALNLGRGKGQAEQEELPSQLCAPVAPPELGYVKARYRDAFKQAFEDGFRALSARERTLLRLNLLDGLSTAKLARVYRADPSSVRRWLAEARKHLLDETRAALKRSVGASDDELESVMGALVTQLEESVRRILDGSRAG